MGLSRSLKALFRGNLRLTDLPREGLLRISKVPRRKAERRDLERLDSFPARFADNFPPRNSVAEHFPHRPPAFFPHKSEVLASLVNKNFPDEAAELINHADLILQDKWALAGFGMLDFSRHNAWRCDPLPGGRDWGLDYHADVIAYIPNGPDIRILWELNRMGHTLTLALAFSLTNDERYAEKFFAQIDDWMRQNPYGRGANWHSAMEVAIRAINLLAAFDVIRTAFASTEPQVAQILKLFDQHGRFISGNDEFSYISTSNHYLTNVAGLFWIGTCLPELESAAEWRQFGLSEMLREMDKQILADGADFESSTGYHRFISELLLYSFLLADRNDIDIDRKYWEKLAAMFTYSFGIVRPEGKLPLVGDADGSRVVPLEKHEGGDVEYLLGTAAVVFGRQEFRAAAALTPEVVWLTGEKGLKFHRHLDIREHVHKSAAFPDAGSYVMRDGDLYLHFNANDAGLHGRGSHAHNDALSVEIAAFGRAMIVDPGSFVYNLDRPGRHTFRATAYHSTVVVDGVEQNTIDPDRPFIIGNEAKPKVLLWSTTGEADRVVGEHYGYTRLKDPLVHRREVYFSKRQRYWSITDVLTGGGRHHFSFRFHVAPGLSLDEVDNRTVRILDAEIGGLLIRVLNANLSFAALPAFVSHEYGHRESSQILTWGTESAAPYRAAFVIVPFGLSENAASTLELLARVTENTQSQCAE